MSSFNRCTHCHPHGGVAGGGAVRNETERPAKPWTLSEHTAYEESSLSGSTWFHMQGAVRWRRGRGSGMFPCLEKNMLQAFPDAETWILTYRGPAPFLVTF